MTITATTTATSTATAAATSAARPPATDLATRSHAPRCDAPAGGPTGRLLELVPARLDGQARRMSAAAQALVDEPPPSPPDTGASAAATRRALERLGSRTARTASAADALAVELDRVVDLLRDTDDTVASAFSRVRSGATR